MITSSIYNDAFYLVPIDSKQSKKSLEKTGGKYQLKENRCLLITFNLTSPAASPSLGFSYLGASSKDICKADLYAAKVSEALHVRGSFILFCFSSYS